MRIILFCIILSFQLPVKSQYIVDYFIDLYENQTIYTCSGYLLPDWGNCPPTPSNRYCDNRNYTITFCNPTPGQNISLGFLPLYFAGIVGNTSTLHLEENQDFIYIYDGLNTTAPLLVSLTGTVSDPFYVTSTSGCLTIQFISDDDINGFGWLGTLGCEPVGCNENPPAGRICEEATQICNFNGYCGNTSGWYIPDNYVLGSDFPPFNKFCGAIHNNSWLKFVASESSVNLDITSSNCEQSPGGIQAAIYQTNDCETFTLISNCISQVNPGSFNISTNVPLTIGETYYLMIDGYENNSCNYVVNTNSGILSYTISGPPGNMICMGATTTLTVNGAPPNATYQWSPASAIIGSSTGQLVNVNPVTATEYRVIVNSTLCDIDTVYYTLNVENPTASANNSGPFCEGGAISLSASGGATYAWTDPGGFTSNSQNPTRPNATVAMAGTYTVIVTDAYGCSDTTITSVVVNPLPVISVSPSGPLEICPPATALINFNTSGFSNIQWYSGAGALSGQNGSSLTITSAGNYYVTAMDVNGCTGTSNQVSVTETVNTLPVFSAIPPICSGDAPPVLPSTSNNGITGTWSPATVSNSTSGTYTFTPDAGQCAMPTTLDVIVNQPITPGFAPIPDLCDGDAAPVLPGSSIEGISGTWNPSTVNNTTTNDYLFTPFAGQCAVQTTITIQVNDLPITTPVYHD